MEILGLKDIDKAIDRLNEGKVLVCPTDTVYGFVAKIDNKDAMERISQIKEREKGKPFPIFVKDIEMAKELAEISSSQEKFLDSVWPGKVTAILKSKGKVLKELELNGAIAIRIPDHEFLQSLLTEPLSGTSANLAGEPSISDSKEILNKFEGREFKPDVLIDAGALEYSLPSTIIDMTKEPTEVIRKGAIII